MSNSLRLFGIKCREAMSFLRQRSFTALVGTSEPGQLCELRVNEQLVQCAGGEGGSAELGLVG